MDLSNQTLVTYFILIGFSQNLQISILLFVIFLLLYTLIILGNSFLIFTVIVSPKLHTPMYYFLCNLSFLDLCCSSCSVPRLLLDTLSKIRRISLIGCLIQMNFSLFLGGTECILLAVMAYDRYIAICSPLYYTTIMSWRVCRYFTVIMWLGSFILSTVPTMVKPLKFCKENILNHFVCEVLALLEVACGDLSFYKITIVAIGFFTLLSPLVLIVVSYICIIISILKIHSVEGRSKAFSTCASHLTVVFIYFVTIMIMYMGQTRRFSSHVKYISLIYAMFTPVLNPVIYSLRNNEVKEGFLKILTTGCMTHTML
ncbi:olfactory receptor 13C9-like [Hyla sarda]|uniref:olfactory receptor 13C9-like n=1 Tax=Hyla sarda TaxID=327740 RepID=UPI0024C423E2|nr:olfactory receptor 13C9-like [Hyla sarda]